LAATDIETVPLAVPLAPAVIAIQPTRLDAVQLQPVSVVTSTDTRPPSEPTESTFRLRLKRQGAPAWLNGTESLPTEIDALRAVGTGFGAM
jgi:hypothetical protein